MNFKINLGSKKSIRSSRIISFDVVIIEPASTNSIESSARCAIKNEILHSSNRCARQTKVRKFIDLVGFNSSFLAATGNALIRRQVELTLPVSELGHLLGREGCRHKEIMKETSTRIHFENAPYASDSNSWRSSGFDLESFQSAAPLQAMITSHSEENIQKAIEALQSLDQEIQVCQVSGNIHRNLECFFRIIHAYDQIRCGNHSLILFVKILFLQNKFHPKTEPLIEISGKKLSAFVHRNFKQLA